MQAQYVGTNVRIENAFDVGGVPTDPTTVLLTLKIPGNDTPVVYTFPASPEISKDAIGQYRFDYVPTVAGTYVFTWLGTGTVVAQSLSFFEVLAAITTDVRVPGYMTSADLDKRIGAAKVDELFCDDGSGVRDPVVVNTFLVEAEDFAATYLLSAWKSVEQLATMAANDETMRGQVAWVALELASERRPEFLASDGKGNFWAQMQRSISYFNLISKGRLASVAEGRIGVSAQAGGRLNPPPVAPPPAGRFTWATDRNNPRGGGGF